MRKVFLLVLSVFLLAAGCDLFKPVEYGTDITVNGLVKDQGGSPVTGATVVLTGASATQSATTDGEGVYHFAGVKAGTYSLSFRAAGYARVNTEQFKIDNAATIAVDSGLTSYAYTENFNVILYAETATLTGSLFYGDNVPAAGAVVRADFTYNETPALSARALTEVDESYTAVVAADGSYSFDAANATPNGLPRYKSVHVYVEQFTAGGIDFGGLELAGSPFDLSGAAGKALAATTLSPVASDPLLRTTGLPEAFVPSTGIIGLSFSREVDPAKCSFALASDLTTSPAFATLLIPYDEGAGGWAADHLSVALKPEDEPDVGTPYYVIYTITDAAGYASSGNLTLNTIPGIDLVSSNVDAAYAATTYDGLAEIAVGDDLAFVFNVVPSAVSNLSLYSRHDSTARSFTTTVTGNGIAINPSSDLVAGLEYTVRLTVASSSLADEADKVTVTRSFFTAGTVALTAPSDFALSAATANADFDTTSLSFTFTEPNYADSFELYARYYDSAVTGTEWQYVGSAATLRKDYYPSATVITNSIAATLTAAYFDPFKDDAFVAPFVGDRKIEFKLVTYDAKGNDYESFLGGTEPYVEDTVAPTATIALTTGTIAASAGLAAANDVVFTVTMGNSANGHPEYIKLPSASNVTVTDFTLVSTAAMPNGSSNFAWVTGYTPTSFTFDFTFAENTVLETGDDLIIVIRDLGDNASNQITFTVP